MEIFTENPNKNNLINSSILEMFDILTKDYNKKLGAYIVTFIFWNFNHIYMYIDVEFWVNFEASRQWEII
jgi:hypothetical protein